MTQQDVPLPLPDDSTPGVPFGTLVDRYVAAHGVTRKECFRRIAAVTRNEVNGLSTRYHQRGGEVWRFSRGDNWREDS